MLRKLYKTSWHYAEETKNDSWHSAEETIKCANAMQKMPVPNKPHGVCGR